MLKKHPKGLVFIFFAEMWERVGFSTLVAILLLICMKRLKRFSG
jgi:dipeptide/tripeptide permease